ncbi:molybdate ABC transporter permease subunit [Mangrovibacterium diazotrophicum]|uniref:Molybdenum transport system permease n=1 Tax=Mangrovibacterium diazotrophicum TaxID=1261403 RepID=A0A419W2G2_9BACT|nr:molybdate ABC transporter permease subunit [Mangrovibacterium diazotrophicum]RKD89676.1 molybdate transport system permease protein [Mangrovibacterium diazotrophicum]
MSDLFHFTGSEFEAIRLSIGVAVYSSLISLPFALLLGYILARKQFTGKAVVESFIHLPLVMPPVTTGYLLLLILGTRGFIGKWLFEVFGLKLAFTFEAAVIASVVVSFPLIVRSIRTAIEMVDPGLEDASRILGIGRLKTFFRITVPLAAPGILSGTILAFARSLGEFGATITFAGNIAGETQTLPLAVFAYMQVPGREGETLRLVLISVLISFVAMALSELYIRKMKRS